MSNNLINTLLYYIYVFLYEHNIRGFIIVYYSNDERKDTEKKGFCFV